MLNKLPLAIRPAKSAAAVGPDRRFVAELTGTLEAELDAPGFDAPKLDAVEVLDPFPWIEAIWAFTRFSAR
jgi:hypothetical protein